ncbi:DUF790 family protein, partial [Candidatus Poribacteria bacterium]|nr:DUF790 family protein [Candidatus Poribacteria bacterium]
MNSKVTRSYAPDARGFRYASICVGLGLSGEAYRNHVLRDALRRFNIDPMLPSDLIRYQIHGDDIRIVYVRPESERYQSIAGDLIEIYTTHLGKPKGTLAEALADYEAADTNYHVTRGLAKLLEDLSEFTIQSPMDAEVLREKIFVYASEYHPIVTQIDLLHRHTRSGALAGLAAELGISVDKVIGSMYADLEENRILTAFEPPTPQWLLERYNVALAQA